MKVIVFGAALLALFTPLHSAAPAGESVLMQPVTPTPPPFTPTWQQKSDRHLVLKFDGLGQYTISSASVSADGNYIAAVFSKPIGSNSPKRLGVWNIDSQARVFLRKTGSGYFFFTNAINQSYTTNSTGTYIWNIPQGTKQATHPKTPYYDSNMGEYEAPDISTNGHYAISRGENKLHVWNISNGVDIASLTEKVDTYGWAGNRDVFFTTTITEDGAQETYKFWNLDGQLINSITRHGTDEIEEAGDDAVSPDGKLFLLAGGYKSPTRIVEVDTGKLVSQIPSGERFELTSWHPSNNYVVSSSPNGKRTNIWNARTGKLINTYHHRQRTSGRDFSPDGSKLLIDSKANNLLLDLKTGHKMRLPTSVEFHHCPWRIVGLDFPNIIHIIDIPARITKPMAAARRKPRRRRRA